MNCRYIDIITSYLQSNIVALKSYNDSTEVTYMQLGGCIGYYQQHLLQVGISHGDKVILLGQNSVGWCASYLAIQFLGAIVVPLSKQIPLDDLTDYVNHCDAKAIITDINTGVLPNINLPVVPLQKFVEERDRKPYVIADNLENNDICSIIYTSGTTEQPKGVMLPFSSLSLTLEHALSKMPLQPEDTICSCLPFEHSFGCMYNMLYPLAAGANNMIISTALSVPVLIDAFAKHHPKILYIVPLFIEKIYAKAIKETADSIDILNNILNLFGGKIQDVLVGGAALNPEIEHQLVSIGFPLGGGYGMSECGPTISYASSKEHVNGSVGYVVDHLETNIRQLNQTGSGELLVRGDNVFLGYYKNIASTEKVLDADGWLHTGDMVRIEHTDKGRLLYIVGRCKNMILLSNGENVYPEEIEGIVNKLPHVLSSLAICRGNSLVVKVHMEPDLDPTKKNELLQAYQIQCNHSLPRRMQIEKFELQEEDFERTEKKTIKRFLYN